MIVADIGGTNARFGWVEHAGGIPAHVRTLPTVEHPGPGSAMARYLDELPLACRHAVEDRGLVAGWALASVIDGADTIEMTNNHWVFSRQEEAQRMGLKGLHLFNDFEALAHSLPTLGAGQVRSWDGRMPAPDAPLAVVGPGTGLGVAGIVPSPSGWIALSGEGGHATLAPVDDFESEVLRQARLEWPHVSAERLLSGIGLPLLHRCVARASGRAAVDLETELIVAQGLAGDEGARRTLDLFCAMLGGHAGNVALVLGARGGVYIGGGLVPRLGELFFQSEFRRRFEDKGRFHAYLAQIPTVLITDTMVALRGVSAAVSQRCHAEQVAGAAGATEALHAGAGAAGRAGHPNVSGSPFAEA